MTTQTTFVQADAFAGWLRSAGTPYRRVCTAATADACWAALLDLPSIDGGCDRVVLPAGQVPRGERRPFRRRLL